MTFSTTNFKSSIKSFLTVNVELNVGANAGTKLWNHSICSSIWFSSADEIYLLILGLITCDLSLEYYVSMYWVNRFVKNEIPRLYLCAVLL